MRDANTVLFFVATLSVAGFAQTQEIRPSVVAVDTSKSASQEYDAGKIKFIASNKETGGKFSLVELTEMPGYKTAWHQHNNCEESFYVLEGILTIKIAGRTRRLPAGSYVFIPRGTPHGQGNFTDKPVRLLTTFAPGGFDDFFRDRVDLFKSTKPGDPQFKGRFDELRAKHSQWVEILGTWEPDR